MIQRFHTPVHSSVVQQIRVCVRVHACAVCPLRYAFISVPGVVCIFVNGLHIHRETSVITSRASLKLPQTITAARDPTGCCISDFMSTYLVRKFWISSTCTSVLAHVQWGINIPHHTASMSYSCDNSHFILQIGGVPKGRGVGGFNPHPPRNSKHIGGVLDRLSKKNRRLDFLM